MEAEPEDNVGHAVAPVVTAGELKAGLNVGVGVNCALVPLAHLALQLGQLCLQRDGLGTAAKYVIAQSQRALARRPLVVQRKARSLSERELP